MVSQPAHFAQFVDLNDIFQPGDQLDTEDDSDECSELGDVDAGAEGEDEDGLAGGLDRTPAAGLRLGRDALAGCAFGGVLTADDGVLTGELPLGELATAAEGPTDLPPLPFDAGISIHMGDRGEDLSV